MTQKREFKQIVRERMEKTGERYTAARAYLIQSTSAPTEPIKGLFPGYTRFGGVCRDTGALTNALAQAGVVGPHTKKPLTEAMVSGLCGGVGFLYAVFEYKGMPPMISVMCRYDTMPDGFIAGGIARLGPKTTVSETTSAATARKALDAAIAAKRPAICTVDVVGLSGSTSPIAMAGMAPTVVTVAGIDGDDLLIDDGGVLPRRMSIAEFMKARALYKKGKNRLVTIDAAPSGLDLAAVVRGAAADCAHRYSNAPFKGFASNFGFAGIEKFQRLLTDPKDKKGWPTLFHEGAAAYMGLRRTYDGIEHDFTAPAAGRPLYAEFLEEAADLTGEPRYAKAAEAFRRSGERWRAMTDAIAKCGDAAVERGCTLGDSAREMMDACIVQSGKERSADQEKRMELMRSCKMTRADAAALYAKLAGIVGEILEAEREGVAVIEGIG